MRYVVICIISFFIIAQPLYSGVIKGTVACKGVRDSRGVVVYVEKVDEPDTTTKAPTIMDQVNLEFLPHVLPIVKGTTVDFKNSDDVLHNVFTPDKCAEKMNLGTWPKGEMRSYTFNEIGCVSVILCNVHPEMEAWVLVLQNSYFFKTDKAGTYEIKGIPAGKYILKVWHERLKNQSVEIEVPAEGEVEANFTLKRR
ncbi:MAG: hypothetical protein IIB45_04480 [Candidatus Marinimicrobia bacterium]|nr:hypothetical protein [Candidatus Neomarinimicrobiota bacterium]